MILKNFNIFLLYLLICFFQFSYGFSNTNLKIKVIVENEIITNHDIIKESKYLKLLNPNLQNLNDDKILPIAKNSLINEKIKKKEIEKIFDFNKQNPLIDEVYKNLFQKIGFNTENEFENLLIKKKNYTPKEIKEKLKIEIYWNDLIFLKYKNQTIINENDLKNKIKNQKESIKKEYFLSEIIFEKNTKLNFEEQVKNIKNSIETVGFNNTANIYSISNSSKFGGKVGWINENSLSKIISQTIAKLKKGEISEVIQIGNNYLLIKIEDIRTSKVIINEEIELKKMIEFERNQQLNRFSNIYYNKSKMNYVINEK